MKRNYNLIGWTICGALVIGVLVQKSIVIGQQDEVDHELREDEMDKKFPFYTSGLDREGSPVWIIEHGKWDMSRVHSGNRVNEAKFDAHWDKMTKAQMDSPNNSSLPGVSSIVLISDELGFVMSQWLNFRSISKAVSVVRKYRDVVTSGQTSVKKLYFINSTFKGILPAMNDIGSPESFGSDPNEWKPGSI